MKLAHVAAGLLLAFSLQGGALAATSLELAHHLPAAERGWLERLVERFNAGQKDVEVRLVEAGSGVHDLSLLDPATAAALGGEKVFRPLPSVMSGGGQKFDAKAIAPELASLVSDSRGRLQALPLAQSTPVLMFNKKSFLAVGLDPEQPPRTWFEVQQAADKLFDAGSKCPFTSSRPSEMLIEQTSLWHGEPIFGKARQPVFNGMLQVKHIAMMSSWVKARFFIIHGREDEADAHFASGECGMITSGSNRFAAFKAAGVDVGVARLPIHEGYFGAPKNTVADGLALWVAQRLGKAETRGAARFVAFLMTPESQTELARAGGFLPFAAAGRAALEGLLLAADAPQQRIALAQIKGSRAGTLLSRLPRARRVIDEELEAVWADRKPAKAALDSAVARIGSVDFRLTAANR